VRRRRGGAEAEPPVTKAIDVRLPRSRQCAAIARRLVEEHLGGNSPQDRLDDVKLVVSELVDNAYLHGRGQLRLVLRPTGRFVRIEVIDEGRGAAIKIRERAADEAGGFGLKLVEQLSSAWGAYEGTTHVWAEVPLDVS
jgi:anti-sigma regulatory factor (Ser/Thr protein kinase)